MKNKEDPAIITSGGLYLNKKNIDFNLFGKYVSPFESIRFAPKNADPQPLGDFFTIDCNGGYTLKGKIPIRFYFRSAISLIKSIQQLSDIRILGGLCIWECVSALQRTSRNKSNSRL